MKTSVFVGIAAAIAFVSACADPVESKAEDPVIIEAELPSNDGPDPIQILHTRDEGWLRVKLGREGLLIDLPGAPIECKIIGTVPPDSMKRCYQSAQVVPERFLVTIWANTFDQGIFSDEVIRATFEGAEAGLLQPANGQTVTDVVYGSFLGFPSQELKLNDRLEDQAILSRRLSFAVDGGYFVVSIAGNADSSDLDAFYQRVIDSVELSGMDFLPGERFVDQRSRISMLSPSGWEQLPPEQPFEVGRFRNLTRMMILKASGQASFGCPQYKESVEQQFASESVDADVFRDGKATFFETTQPVPDYDLDLKVLHYCWDTSGGAVALEAVSEENTAARWRTVFEGSAKSVSVLN